jgi:DNA polymerase-4
MLSREIDGTAYRLIGAGVSALKPGSEADDQDLLDRRPLMPNARWIMSKEFGNAAVMRGIAYDGPPKAE